MSTTVNPKLEFTKTLEILATRLTKTEYDRTTSTLFLLYCGDSMGFEQNADPYLIPTFKRVWEETKQKRLDNFAVIRRFKVYENKEKEIGQGVKNVIRQRITENGDESEKS
jgi:hypothetical protein